MAVVADEVAVGCAEGADRRTARAPRSAHDVLDRCDGANFQSGISECADPSGPRHRPVDPGLRCCWKRVCGFRRRGVLRDPKVIARLAHQKFVHANEFALVLKAAAAGGEPGFGVEGHHRHGIGQDVLGGGSVRRIEADDAAGEALCIPPAEIRVPGGVVQLARDEPVAPAAQEESESEIVVSPDVSHGGAVTEVHGAAVYDLVSWACGSRLRAAVAMSAKVAAASLVHGQGNTARCPANAPRGKVFRATVVMISSASRSFTGTVYVMPK